MEQIINMTKYFRLQKEFLFSAVMMAALVLITIIPISTTVIDFLIIFSFGASIFALLASTYTKNKKYLAILPAVIIFLSLYRVFLNAITTNSILNQGHNVPSSISQIIASVGEFFVGSSYVLGIIVFTILTVVNFLVITKVFSTISEVSARFTLDSLPGKQMAIDQDLQAGYISDKKAKKLREDLMKEGEIYGLIDGSSKFVKGEVVAGVIITIINIIGGFMVGVFTHGMDIASSVKTYTLLTIGDGLTSQIPVLLFSIAMAMVITRLMKDSKNISV